MTRVVETSLCLAVGAAINVAVAWSCVALGTLKVVNGQQRRPPTARPDVPESGWLAPTRLDWPVPVPTHWPEPSGVAWSGSIGVDWRSGMTSWDDPKHTVQALWAGWPMKSLSWVQRETTDSAGARTTWSEGVGPLVPRAGNAGPGTMSNWGWAAGWVPRQLPLSPVWLGSAVNTFLYAIGVWCLGAAAILSARRWVRAHRSRRGACLRCGYPVSGLQGCPECGNGRLPAPIP